MVNFVFLFLQTTVIKMIRTIGKYIAERQLLSPGSTVVVGLSGGMDSMALLDVLTLSGYRCIAAHCNFHLRGEESDSDARFVKKWCKENDVEFTSIDFDTRQYAADKKISIEMAARELRYSWFEIVREEYAAEAIAVAHHRDDLAETVLLNLIRGTGIRGLTGISPKNGHVVRPMLSVSRSEIETYMKERDIPYVTDSTNADDTFVRNSLRLNIIPMLEKLNPSVKEAIYRTSQNLSEAVKIYEKAIESDTKEIFNDNSIDIEKLKQTASPATVLFEILTPFGFNPSVIEDISENLDATPGKVFNSGQYRLIKDRHFLLLSSLPHENNDIQEYAISNTLEEMTDPIHLKISKYDYIPDVLKNPSFLFADAGKIQFPLTLRKWKPGDWFIPFGMKGKKKLSDYFTDRKFNLTEKENVWVLTSGNDIVWIVGERTDDRFKITKRTDNVVVIELLGK